MVLVLSRFQFATKSRKNHEQSTKGWICHAFLDLWSFFLQRTNTGQQAKGHRRTAWHESAVHRLLSWECGIVLLVTTDSLSLNIADLPVHGNTERLDLLDLGRTFTGLHLPCHAARGRAPVTLQTPLNMKCLADWCIIARWRAQMQGEWPRT